MLRSSIGLGVLVLVLIAAPAHAGAPAEACDDARRLLDGKDLVRASIAASLCEDAGDQRAAALVAEVDRKAIAKGYSPVEIVTQPAGGTVFVEPAPDLPFAAPRRVWLPEGRHQVTGVVDGQPVAVALVVARDGNRTVALIELPAPPPPPGTGSIDFGDEGGGEMSSGPPPKVELPSLLPDRYLRGVAATGGDDAPRARRQGAWTLSVGPVVGAVGGGGMAVGAALSLERRFELTRRIAFAPEAIAQVVSVEDEMGERAALAGIHAEAAVQLSTGLGGSVRGALGAGPSCSFDAGPGGSGGTGLGVTGVAELERRRRQVLALRVEVPLWSGADQRIVSMALLLGRRW